MKLNPDQFKVIKREIVFKSEKVAIAKAVLQLPNNNQVEWFYSELPNLCFAAVVKEDQVIMVKEFRIGPGLIMTGFVGARNFTNNKGSDQPELTRELSEELGISNPKFEFVFQCNNGIHISGKVSYFLVTEFETGIAHPDNNELLEVVTLPIVGLYQELLTNHNTTPQTLLMAKILEQKFAK
jgi:hypothetical protein